MTGPSLLTSFKLYVKIAINLVHVYKKAPHKPHMTILTDYVVNILWSKKSNRQRYHRLSLHFRKSSLPFGNMAPANQLFRH